MDFAPVIASALAAFVTASVTSWASLRTSRTTWQAAHSDRTFEALADLLDATDLDRHDGRHPLSFTSARTRVRITTGGPVRDLAEGVIGAAADFNRAHVDSWRRQHPYFQLLDALRENAKDAQVCISRIDEEDDSFGVALEALHIKARDALEVFYARQDAGEDPDAAPVRKAIKDTDCFGTEEVDALLLPPTERRALHQGLADRQRRRAESRAALVDAHKQLANAVAMSSTTPPARLARQLRRAR
ncbi:hypothetical protein [Streptomyces bugieae]|uniref:Secreted protein n=1 Tax=Streptomyces bugieae TaxID=3098223 RepID=A0ABU7NM27_9ACTN|nr:hypothetical protein [Streptomyces sp. DSM 41528]